MRQTTDTDYGQRTADHGRQTTDDRQRNTDNRIKLKINNSLQLLSDLESPPSGGI